MDRPYCDSCGNPGFSTFDCNCNLKLKVKKDADTVVVLAINNCICGNCGVCYICTQGARDQM